MHSDDTSKPATWSPTFEQYAALFPQSKANSAADFLAFTSACLRFDIDSPVRMAAFCAQISHESAGRTRFVENLNYTAGRLPQVNASWRRKFSPRAVAVAYARKGPQAIANKAYAYVNGNGDEASGDGWRFRGRGEIQLTGRGNYARAEAGTGIPLVSDPDRAADPKESPYIAAWYWSTIDGNTLADKGDFMELTRRINGGTIGYADRELRLRKALEILSHKEAA